MPWCGPAGTARHTGASVCGLGTRGQSPWCSHQSGSAPSGAAPSRVSGAQKRRPRTARRRRATCRQARCAARLLHRRCSAAGAKERATGARPARREARAPAGQVKNAAPAGAQNARDRARHLKTPAPLTPAPDRHPDGPGLEARSAQRTERVARRAARSCSLQSNLSLVPGYASEFENINRTYACQKGLIPTERHKLSQR